MRRVLFDTHVFIWLAEEPDRLTRAAYRYIHSDDRIYLSYVSVWEMSIKIKTGKLTLQFPLEEFIQTAFEKHTFVFLPIALSHIYASQALPLHHRDPFDRLLIAQSVTEGISVVSSDIQWDAYGVQRIW